MNVFFAQCREDFERGGIPANSLRKESMQNNVGFAFLDSASIFSALRN